MFKLVYVSRAAPHVGRDEVRSIADRAQVKNSVLGVTGFLCLHDGIFLQYLEGEESAVRDLFGAIRCDDRHTILRVIELGHQADRNFATWGMRYLDDDFLGHMVIEDVLKGVVLEFGRGQVEEWRAHAMADRLVGRIAALAH